jgi:hypothetical protein
MTGKPRYASPPLIEKRRPRCPPYVEYSSVEQLLPYLDAVAKRPYNHGLHAAWDLKPGERVLLRADNWHDPIVIEACKRILEKYGVKYEIKMVDKGPVPQWEGHDEAEYYINRTKELADWMDQWEQIEREGKYDKLLWGYGGPVLRAQHVKVQRMPFITPELLASPAHTMPWQVLYALDEWCWNIVRRAKRVHITDPEGTDLWFTNHDEYYDNRREFLNPELVKTFWSGNEEFGKTYLPGHVIGRPWLFIPKEDGHGVIAGTTNHIAAFPWMQLKVESSKIVEIVEGGLFGEKLRRIMADTADVQYPGFPGKGIMYWWEASIGTNPHIHRPRAGFPSGWVNCLYERMRSGVIHMGFGTIISSHLERVAANQGLLVGHWHIHLYFPTVTCDMPGGGLETVIEDGRVVGLDDPAIRRLAARFGDPDLMLNESWIPAVPGINVAGDYWRHYADDPLKWVKAELEICRNWHHLFTQFVDGDPKYCRQITHDWKVVEAHACGHDHAAPGGRLD